MSMLTSRAEDQRLSLELRGRWRGGSWDTRGEVRWLSIRLLHRSGQPDDRFEETDASDVSSTKCHVCLICLCRDRGKTA